MSMIPNIDISASHGPAKHLSRSLSTRLGLEHFGALSVWDNPTNGRRARLCEIGYRQYGIQILKIGQSGDWEEITSFIKEKMNRLEQVEQYLQNRGYQRRET